MLRIIFGNREIETIQKRRAGKPLTQTERNYLSASIRPKLRAIQALARFPLLSDINRRKNHLGRQDICYNLSRYGYELITLFPSGKRTKIPLEELINTIILRYPEPRFIAAIPSLLVKNPANPWKLLELAVQGGWKNELGFLLEIALAHSKNKELSNLLLHLQAVKDEERHLLGEDFGEEYRAFLLQESPPRMRSWNLLGRFFDQDFWRSA